jgi:hypothetical protein
VEAVEERNFDLYIHKSYEFIVDCIIVVVVFLTLQPIVVVLSTAR